MFALLFQRSRLRARTVLAVMTLRNSLIMLPWNARKDLFRLADGRRRGKCFEHEANENGVEMSSKAFGFLFSVNSGH